MSKILRTIAAGWGAKKLGGGCISTVIVFIILWWLLSHFGVFKEIRALTAKASVPVSAKPRTW